MDRWIWAKGDKDTFLFNYDLIRIIESRPDEIRIWFDTMHFVSFKEKEMPLIQAALRERGVNI